MYVEHGNQPPFGQQTQDVRDDWTYLLEEGHLRGRQKPGQRDIIKTKTEKPSCDYPVTGVLHHRLGPDNPL